MILTKKTDIKSMMESDKHEKLKRFWVEKSTSKSSQYFKNTCTCIHLHRDSERRVLVRNWLTAGDRTRNHNICPRTYIYRVKEQTIQYTLLFNVLKKSLQKSKKISLPEKQSAVVQATIYSLVQVDVALFLDSHVSQ